MWIASHHIWQLILLCLFLFCNFLFLFCHFYYNILYRCIITYICNVGCITCGSWLFLFLFCNFIKIFYIFVFNILFFVLSLFIFVCGLHHMWQLMLWIRRGHRPGKRTTKRFLLYNITLHYIILHYITLHYIELHYIRLHNIRLGTIKSPKFGVFWKSSNCLEKRDGNRG